MCRSGADACGARRCKTREEERVAKAVWRAGKKLQQQYGGDVVPRSERAETPMVGGLPDSPAARVEALRAVINTPRGFRSEAEYETELAAAYIELGAAVHELAGPAAEEELAAAQVAHAERLETLKEAVLASRAYEREAYERLDALWTRADEDHDISRKTYPSILDRRAALEGLDDPIAAEYVALTAEIQAAEKKTETDRKAHSDALKESGMQEAILNRREAYIAALRKLGVEFPQPGEELTVKEGGNKKGYDAVQGVVSLFPSAWVNASNEHEEQFIVVHGNHRGMYRHENIATLRGSADSIAYATHRWEPSEEEIASGLFIPFNIKDHYDHETGMVVYQDGEDTYRFHPPASFEKETAWFRPKYTYYVGRTKMGMVSYTPEDTTGWEKQTTINKNVFNPRTSEREDQVVTRWRKRTPRPAPTPENHVMHVSTVVNEHGLDGAEQIAAHEFCHRIEYLDPKVAVAEKAFIAHRAKLHTDTPEILTNISGSEMGYKDNFASHYSGRVYDRVTNYEILSTGVESLFYGAGDGLAGLRGYQKDDEYRNFVLGLFAAAQSRKEGH